MININQKLVIAVIAAVVLIAAYFTMDKPTTINLSDSTSYDLYDTGTEAPNMSMTRDSFNQKLSINGISAPEEDPSSTDKKVIKTGNLTMKISSTDETTNQITNIAKQNDGEIFSTNFTNDSQNIKRGSVTVKVPFANFDKTFSEIKAIAKLVTNESSSGQDVTEEFTDLQSSLKNKQAEEQSFIKILDRAIKIEDVLSITRELSRVRGEIERIQGRIKYLDSQTDLATIYVNLTEYSNITFADNWRPWQVVKDTVNSLFKDLRGFINFIIVLIIRILPIAILYGLIVFLGYRIGKKAYLRLKK